MLSNHLLLWLSSIPARFFMWSVVVLLLLQAGAILLLVVNVHRRRAAEQALKESEAQARQVIESSPVGICIVSEGKFAFANQAYVSMFGYATEDEIIGRHLEELYAPEEGPRQRQYARDRIAGKPVPTAYDTKGLKRDGSHFDVAAWVTLVQYKGLASSLGFIIDRSIEKKLRRRLDQANRLEAIGTLAGGIAHDFNNILTAITGYTELAATRAVDDVEIQKDLQQVLMAGSRAKELVQQILTFSRNEESRLQLIHPGTIVEEVSRLVRISLPANINIQHQVLSESLICGDAIQLHQLLMNLCKNAEYTMRNEGGTIDIIIEDFALNQENFSEYPAITPGDYLCLTVSDTGPGIPEDIKEKIFEPFFTTKGTGEGTGMGLAQVHGIVSNHRGYIRTENNHPHGAKFKMIFPVAAVDSILQDKHEEKNLSGSEKILIVDDEEMVAKVLQQTLIDLGYEVTACTNSLEALELVRGNIQYFDLVLSDMTMPYMTGENLASELLKLRPTLPIVLCTGFSATLDEAEASKLGIRAFLQKPMGKEKLARTLRNILEAP